MLKYTLVALLNCLLINMVMAAASDTTKYYVKDLLFGHNIVGAPNDFDYTMLILPPDPSETLFNVKAFYKSGALKFAGKWKPAAGRQNNSIEGLFQGSTISFFPDGKKQSIANYNNGIKDGLQYDYYPDGKVYTVSKFDAKNYRNNTFLTCNDKDANPICSDGNGRWVVYDNSFEHVLQAGRIKKGRKDGDWTGNTKIFADSIRYVAHYDDGELTSGTSYDKAGYEYPFKKEEERPRYPGNVFEFINDLNDHLKLPKGANGKKMSIETVLISFVIERDGSCSELGILGEPDAKLLQALNEAISHCQPWTPWKFYGVPVRSKITMSIRRLYLVGNQDVQHYTFEEQVIMP